MWSDGGVAGVADALPSELRSRTEPVLVQILLPAEEATLRPISGSGEAEAEEEDRPQRRIAPSLWTIPAVGLRLADAIPWLAAQDAARLPPGMCALAAASQLVLKLIARGDLAPAPQPGVMRYAPHWSKDTQWILAAIAEALPGCLCTARFAVPDDPVYAVTQRNLLVSLVGHALDQVVQAAATAGTPPKPGFEKAERLPKEFWQTPMVPVLEILVPAQPLEEGVPWGLQVLVRPVPTIAFTETIESVHQRLAACPFPSELATDCVVRVEQTIDRVAEKVPSLRRARNLSDGRASLTRSELDQILDHMPLLETEGFELTLPGVESMQRLSARVAIVEAKGQANDPRPWFEFRWSLAVGDNELSQSEFDQLVEARTPLVFIDRRPVLLSPKDREALRDFKKRMAEGGERISFFEALRLRLGGASHLHGLAMESIASTPRLEQLLHNLEQSRSVESRALPEGFLGELRPYQQRGHAWMHFLVDQGFGACLADDMGLGKTVQAIAVMLDWRKRPTSSGSILIVCPVSVLGNWRRELHRFSPSLRVVMHHGKGRAETLEDFRKVMDSHDIILTSYNLLQRDEEIMGSVTFDGVVLDEAQNIKNPTTRQSRVARAMKGNFRLALTGTPLENRPLDLWSIMDFLNEGLLGTRTQFTQTLEHPIVKQRRQ
ncbi:MAG: SNF2-related protein, partial [Planctomycetota bacterium]|nr:SNF2-related protein [Planctomycetota bacterium]